MRNLFPHCCDLFSASAQLQGPLWASPAAALLGCSGCLFPPFLARSFTMLLSPLMRETLLLTQYLASPLAHGCLGTGEALVFCRRLVPSEILELFTVMLIFRRHF